MQINIIFGIAYYIYGNNSLISIELDHNKLSYNEVCGAFYMFGTTPLFNFPAKVSNYMNQSQLYISSTNGASFIGLTVTSTI